MNKFKVFISGIISLLILFAITVIILLLIYSVNIFIIWPIILGAIIVNAIIGIYIMNSKKRTDDVKISWIWVIMTFPLIGIFLFSLFGTNPLKEEKECITDKRLLSNENYKETKKILKTSLNNLNIFRYVFNTQKHPIYGKNNVEIINKNEELLPIIISEIKKAKTSINICTYIIKEGYFLKTLINELIKLNLKGVKIRLMYDYVGSFQKIKSSTIKKIKAAGIEVSIFNHSKFNIFKSATNFRNHKKCIIIDNSVAILGSYNIGDEYLSIDSKTNDWNDLNYKISGEIVNSLNIDFANDWIKFTESNSESKQQLIESISNNEIYSSKNKCYCQLFCSAPNFHNSNIYSLLTDAILSAEKSIKIITPYFIPNVALISAFKTAKMSGVDIQLIIPRKPDNKDYMLPINRKYCLELIGTNFKIYEYDGFIHSKIIIIDDELLLLGSNNLDYRSLLINFENFLLINSKTSAKQFVEYFDESLTHSIESSKENLKQYMNIWRKMIVSLSNIVKPLL